MSDDFPITFDGILRANFLTEFSSVLDLDIFSRNFRNRNKSLELPTFGEGEIRNIMVSSKSEAIYWVTTLKTMAQDFLPYELCRDEHLAVSLLRPKNEKIPVKILNDG